MPLTYNQEFADKIARVSLERFKHLPKTGKPVPDREWTLLACIVQQTMQTSANADHLEVVALGTGSKCLGRNQLSDQGDLLHDSHAEVIARRAFLIYLQEQIEIAEKINRQSLLISEDNLENNACRENNTLVNENSIFFIQDGKCKLKPDINFHFYTSHTPCGDASIFTKQDRKLDCFGCNVEEYPDINDEKESKTNINNCDTEPPSKKLKVSDDQFKNTEAISNSDPPRECNELSLVNENDKVTDESKKNIPSDLYRTGAKVVDGEESDSLLPGISYHTTGVLRTKPGRGDPTLSHSCSDKMLKWNVLGLQGCILSLIIIDPLYLGTIIVGPCPYSQDAMYRAIHGRVKSKLEALKLPLRYKVNTPIVLQSSLEFSYSCAEVSRFCTDVSKLMPSPSSLIWSKSSVHGTKQEVATNGRRLGTTAKNMNTPKSRVSICRFNLFHRSLDLLKTPTFLTLYNSVSFTNYANFKKSSSSDYQEAWKLLREEVLPMWTNKPGHLKHFKPDERYIIKM